MNVTLGGTEYRDVEVRRNGRYADGSPAIQLWDAQGPLATATVWLPEPPAEGCVWIKDWSENEGMLDSLALAGVIEVTGRVAPTGYVVAHEGRLL